MSHSRTQHDPVLAKIRKILAKAEDPAATPDEAETYTAKAAELIAAYGIDRAVLAEEVPGSDVVGDRVVPLDAPYALDKASLLAVVAARLRCRAVQKSEYVGRQKVLSMHLFGYDSDLARVELLYTSLLLQASTGVVRAPVPWGENVAAFRRSWLAGFTAAIGQRLHEAEERAAAAAPAAGGRGMALVLADRTAEVDRSMHERYPQLGTAPRRRLSGMGSGDGYAAGQRADLGGTRVDGRGARQLSR